MAVVLVAQKFTGFNEILPLYPLYNELSFRAAAGDQL